MYTTQLQAGLGLIDETRTLLDLWQPGISAAQLHATALKSGRFPAVADRRLRNIVAECFAPRYLTREGQPATHLKRLLPTLTTAELQQLLLLFTARANPILADFIRSVYWERYAAGNNELSNQDAQAFVIRAIDDGKTVKRWSEMTTRKVAAYLTGCCADYGLLANGVRSTRRILPFRIATKVAAYLAYDLHFAGVGDSALLRNQDWGLFGLDAADVLEELRRLALQALLIVQAGGDVVRISWKHHDMETLCDALAQS